MIKHKRFLFALLGLFILSTAGIVLFSPRPIMDSDSIDSVQSIRVIYNPYVNQNRDGMIEIYDYDAAHILDCLSRYKERRTFSRAKTYWMGDVEMQIIVVSAGGLKNILLGNLNYTSGGYGEFKFKIINPEELLGELKDYISYN